MGAFDDGDGHEISVDPGHLEGGEMVFIHAHATIRNQAVHEDRDSVMAEANEKQALATGLSSGSIRWLIRGSAGDG